MLNIFKKQRTNIPIINATNSLKPTVLISLDGYGIAPPSEGNAIALAKKPTMDYFMAHYPHGELIASGESVGLPANEDGNSEVGHLTMGVGRVILQSLKRINASIEDGTFFENPALIATFDHAKRHNSRLHVMGLVSKGSVHSSLDHFWALIEYCKKQMFANVRFHLITDGRDASPTAGIDVVKQIEDSINLSRIGMIASVSGRYWAMDRDMRWERTKRAYDAIVAGEGPTSESASTAIQASYDAKKTDEFMEPTVIVKNGKPVGTVDDNDAVLFFNFRVDRPRQLTMAFVLENFENLEGFQMGEEVEHTQKRKEHEVLKGKTFKRGKWPANMFFTTMTEYQKNVPVSAICFPPIKAKMSLPEVLSKQNIKQLALTESEKERMVTIYFDGLNEGGFPGKDVVIVPSPKVATYDKKPEMSVYLVVDELEKQLAKNYYKFIVMNFANPDMVAHSGNLKATVKAVEHVDAALGRVYQLIKAYQGNLVITADHGNAEELLSYPKGSFFFTTSGGDMNTDHSNNPVPIIVVSPSLEGRVRTFPKGTLSDIAPTVLGLLGIQPPSQMKGKNLLTINNQAQQKTALSSTLPWVQPEV